MNKTELREYVHIDRELNDLERRIEWTKSQILKPKSTTCVETLINLESLFTVKWDQLIDLRFTIEKSINKLPPLECTLMRLKYIDGLTWEEVAVKLNYSWRWVHKLHSRALQKIK